MANSKEEFQKNIKAFLENNLFHNATKYVSAQEEHLDGEIIMFIEEFDKSQGQIVLKEAIKMYSNKVKLSSQGIKALDTKIDWSSATLALAAKGEMINAKYPITMPIESTQPKV